MNNQLLLSNATRVCGFSSTKYKNNSQNSNKFKGCRPFQLFGNLKGKCHAVGYYSYTKRWLQAKKTPRIWIQMIYQENLTMGF